MKFLGVFWVEDIISAKSAKEQKGKKQCAVFQVEARGQFGGLKYTRE